MPFRPSTTVTPLLVQASQVLGLTQGQTAERFGASKRTVARWHAGAALPDVELIATVARAVYDVDPGLAAKLAAEAGTTLHAIGVVPAALPPAPAPPPPAPPRRHFPPIPLLV